VSVFFANSGGVEFYADQLMDFGMKVCILNRNQTFTAMSTYTQILYQIVFSTKCRMPVLAKHNRETLFKFINQTIQNKNCKPLQINGVEDHIHIIMNLHPTVALADLVKDIKVSSTLFIKREKLFPYFIGWQNGYGAFTYSSEALDNLIRYVQNQEEHHAKKKGFRSEYLSLLEEHGVDFDEKYV
jgi:REP element-mobilizing transposase RayT